MARLCGGGSPHRCLCSGTLVPRPLLAGGRSAKRRTGASWCSAIRSIPTSPFRSTTACWRTFDSLVHAGIPVDLPDVRYLVFGWGGRAFYIETPTWAELKPVRCFRR